MPGHKRAEQMIEYGEDARTTDLPWHLWECRHQRHELWTPLKAHPQWEINMEYRRKPITTTINGFEVVDGDVLTQGSPDYEELWMEDGGVQSWASKIGEEFVLTKEGMGLMIERGFIHKSEKSAADHCKARCFIDPNK